MTEVDASADVHDSTEALSCNGTSESQLHRGGNSFMPVDLENDKGFGVSPETLVVHNNEDAFRYCTEKSEKKTSIVKRQPSTMGKATSTGGGSSPEKKATSKPLAAQSTTSKSAIAPIKKSSGPAPSFSKFSSVSQAPVRKASTAPSKTATASAAKPVSSNSKMVNTTSAARSSVVSPSGSTTSSTSRPRQSLSDGLKKVPSKSVTPASKLSNSSRPLLTRASNPMSSRTNPSMTSICEFGPAKKFSEDPRLKEKTESLFNKEELMEKLQNQISDLSTSLDSASADVDAKNTLVELLNSQIISLENELEEARRVLHLLETKEEDSGTSLASLQEELDIAKSSAAEQTALIMNLRADILVLKEKVSLSGDALKPLQSISTDVMFFQNREPLIAKSDLGVISSEMDSLKLEHTGALQLTIDSLETKAAAVDELCFQIASLKAEKCDNADKVSELEVEVLELKERLDVVEEERNQSLIAIKDLKEQLSTVNTAKERAIEETKGRATEFSIQLGNLENSYESQLQKSRYECMKVAESFDALKIDFAELTAAKDLLESKGLATQGAHKLNLEEAEQAHAEREGKLLKKISDITATLESQESIYISKIDAVKEEHRQLLEETYEKAKQEAAAAHSQELLALRVSSSTTIEQVKAAHQASLDVLQSEQIVKLNSQVAHYEKIITSLKLDLKATQDDLSKAKTGLELSRGEINKLNAERGDVQDFIAASANVSAAKDEAARLAELLTGTNEDLATTKDLLNLTKGSLSELSNNHTRELEEAAKARAEEIRRLHSSYESEIKILSSERSTLIFKLSDLDGELSTLKATIATAPLVAKSNESEVMPKSPGLTREELQRMHEAHNLKLHDIVAEHQKALKSLKDELEDSKSEILKLQQDVARKTMEIKYLEQDKEEDQEQIRRLQEEIISHSDR